MREKITILGINGGFGALFSRLLFMKGEVAITGIDLTDTVSQSAKCAKYIQSDLTLGNDGIKSTISESDLIIICLPENVAYKFLEGYERDILKTALLVDTLSIKKEIASFYIKHDFNALSLNPMFGPDLSIDGKNMIVIKFKETQVSDWFVSLLKLWKVNLVYTTSDQHDQISSIVQVATHATIMAFGITLNNTDISTAVLLEVATPPFLSMSTLFGRIISGNKKVYWNIQQENVYASAVRKAIINNLIALDQSIDNGREEDFNKLIEAKTAHQQEIFQKLADDFSSFIKEKN